MRKKCCCDESTVPPDPGPNCKICGTAASLDFPKPTYQVVCVGFRSGVVIGNRQCLAFGGAAGWGVINGATTVFLTHQSPGTGEYAHCATNYYEGSVQDGAGGATMNLIIWGFPICPFIFGSGHPPDAECGLRVNYTASRPGDPPFPIAGINNAGSHHYATTFGGQVGNGIDWIRWCCLDSASLPDGGPDCVCCQEGQVYGSDCNIEAGTVKVL